MTPLHRIIAGEISLNGPMTLGRYTGLCLGHPQHGYYMTRDPFGAVGDFITAPEVSQLFGEMIGAWLADTWMRLGRPQQCALVEAGPGRGTLMADIMRATRRVTGFHDAVQIYLLEMSPVLRDKQRVTLADYPVTWCDSLDDLPADKPFLFVANEFLDALPVEQLEWRGAGWMQRAVGTGPDNSLHTGLKEPEPTLVSSIGTLAANPETGDVIELSPAITVFIHELVERIKKQTGAGLFIDYGYAKTAFGDTVQALNSHQPVSLFHRPGESDMTAHVNFARVAAQIGAMGLCASKIIGQGAFLKTLGIETRLAHLLAQADAAQAARLRSGYERLIAPEQMGTLFKVLGFCHDPDMTLAGLE